METTRTDAAHAPAPKTPERMAKEKVAAIFQALSAYPVDATWRELVRGGYEASVSVAGGQLTAHVGDDGEYAVYAEQRPMRLMTLASGRFTPVLMASAQDGQSDENHDAKYPPQR